MADANTEAENTPGDPLMYPWSGPATGPTMRLAVVSAGAGGTLLAAPHTPSPLPTPCTPHSVPPHSPPALTLCAWAGGDARP